MRVKVSKETKDNLNKLLKELLEKSFHGINEKDSNGNTVLHLAAQISSYKTVKLLIEKGADVSSKNDQGETPLHSAAYRGRVRNIKAIIEAEGFVNARDKTESTPLHYAAMLGSKGNIKGAIKELIGAGANINVQNNEQRTPLLEAAYIIKDIESIKMLIQSGCDVNVGDYNGHTALHYASMGDDERVVEMLIEAGANINAINEYGLEPIFYAERRGKQKVVEALKTKRQRKELSKIGEGYKNIKARGVYKERLKEIERKSYEGINEKNKDEKTVLHLAVNYGSAKKVRELIEKGADVNIGDNEGRRALHHVVLSGRIKTMKILIEAGGNINAAANSGDVPLHYACLVGKKRVVEELIKAGAEINPLNKFGITPMKYANEEIRKLFEKKGGKAIDKLSDVGDECNNIYQGTMSVLDRLTLPELKGKIVNLDEIKKRDEGLLKKEIIGLFDKNINLLKELDKLQKKNDEEKE